MQTVTKKGFGAIFGVVAFLAMLVLFICLPQMAMASDADYAENPYIYFTYEDQNGKQTCGRTLEAGTYDVSVMMEGVSSLSAMQLTATYDTDGATVSPTTALLSDAVSDTTSIGEVLSGGNIVFGFVSDNESFTAVDPDGVCLATFQVTFAEDCDARDVITINENPNTTFIVSVDATSSDDCYAVDDTFEGYSGNMYPMTAEVAPELADESFSVSGSLVIATNKNGATNFAPVKGDFAINVYSDEDCTDSVCTVLTGEDSNSFVIDSLTNGTYYATISSEFALTRTVTIVVEGEDIEAGNIPMFVFDFDKDGYITTGDVIPVYSKISKSDLRYDTDCDGYVTAGDTIPVYACLATPGYDDLTIE